MRPLTFTSSSFGVVTLIPLLSLLRCAFFCLPSPHPSLCSVPCPFDVLSTVPLLGLHVLVPASYLAPSRRAAAFSCITQPTVQWVALRPSLLRSPACDSALLPGAPWGLERVKLDEQHNPGWKTRISQEAHLGNTK